MNSNNGTPTYRYRLTPDWENEGYDLYAHLRNIGDKKIYRFDRALTALSVLFEERLKDGQTATIFTASGSRYVSSCLTNAITDAGGKWSRTYEDNTRIIIAIHEWGYRYPWLRSAKKEAKRRGAILIEDYAYATGLFFSSTIYPRGDFVVLSLRKFFGEPMDGLLLAPASYSPAQSKLLRPGALTACSPIAIRKKRAAVWRWYREDLALSPDVTAAGMREGGGGFGAFLYPCDKEEEGKYMRLKLREFGIECGYWVGNRALFLPVHQSLQRSEVKEISTILKRELEKRRTKHAI